MTGDDKASSGKGGEAAAAPYTSDEHSPETATGLGSGSEIERSVTAATDLIARNENLERLLREAQQGNDVLNELHEQQLGDREATIRDLEGLLAKNGIAVPPRKRPQRVRSGTIPGIPIINVGGETPAPAEPEYMSLPLDDPQRYVDEFLVRMKVTLSKALTEAGGDYGKFFDILNEGYAARSKATRDDMYTKLMELGASENVAADLKIRMLTEDLLYRALAKELEGSLNILDVKSQSMAKRKQEIAEEEQKLQQRLSEAKVTIQKGSEVEAGLNSLEKKTEEVKRILAEKSKLGEDKRELERKKEELKGLASAVKTFYNRVTGAADENRAIMTRAYSGFGPRLDNIISEYATQGAAIIPSMPYKEVLGESVKDPDVIRGAVSPEQKERLIKILEKGAHPEIPIPQKDEMLGWYFITAIRKQGTAVANFCVFGIEEKDGKIEQQRFAQLVATSNSVRDTIIQHYAGMHFLSESGPSGYLREKIDVFFEQVRNL